MAESKVTLKYIGDHVTDFYDEYFFVGIKELF